MHASCEALPEEASLKISKEGDPCVLGQHPAFSLVERQLIILQSRQDDSPN